MCVSSSGQALSAPAASAFAGKFGQLGHGDTAKKAVGRQVKALQHAAVQSVAAGADFMLAVTAWRLPAPGRGGACAAGGGPGSKAGKGKAARTPPLDSAPSLPQQAAAGGEAEEVSQSATMLSPALACFACLPPVSAQRQAAGAALLSSDTGPS